MVKSQVFVLVVLAVIGAQVYGFTVEERDALKEKITPIVRACAEENGVSKEEVLEWKKEKKVPTASQSCMFACIYKKVGLIDENGLFSEQTAVEKSKKVLSSEEDIAKVAETAKACTSVNDQQVSDGVKGCDRAILVFSCMKDHAEKFGIAI